MTAAIRNLAAAQALAMAITIAIGSGLALAENANGEPTIEDLKKLEGAQHYFATPSRSGKFHQA